MVQNKDVHSAFYRLMRKKLCYEKVVTYVESKTKATGHRTYGEHEMEDDAPECSSVLWSVKKSSKWMDGEVPKFLTDEKVGKRYKTYESSLFNTESEDACVNLIVDARYDKEDEVRDVAPRPIGRDKAKNLKKK
ncbi:hypothetical protein Tco_1063861 [Tanacetum coccineum]